jgi:hypothetical protein
MKKSKILLISLLTITTIKADNRIIIYLNSVPEQALNSVEQELAKEQGIKKINNITQKTPGQLSKRLIKNEAKKSSIPKPGGFLALYAGYCDYSNPDGQISFPLRHTTSKLYLVITKKIKLDKLKGETLSHLEFEKEEPTQIYLFEKKKDKRKKFFWKVSLAQKPQNNKISPLSVVLLTNPKNIYVPLAEFMSDATKHLILPNIYAVGNIDKNAMLLNTINIKRYFEPIDVQNEKTSDIVFRKMITNN